MSVGFGATVAFILWLTAFRSGLGVHGDHEKASEKNAVTKQYVMASPFSYQPLPAVSQFNPIVYQSHQYEYVDPMLYAPRDSERGASRAMLVAVLYLLGRQLMTTTTTTVPSTTAVVCSYTAWEACSSICKGTRQRTKVCAGVQQIETEACNTQLGFLSNGWYRAENCYDYFVGSAGTYDNTKSACEGLNGRLASAGIRNDTIRTDLLLKLFDLNTGPVHAYIGADGSTGNWVWSDATTSEPTFWGVGQPGSGTVLDHIRITLGNPVSGTDVDGTANFNSICERAAT